MSKKELSDHLFNQLRMKLVEELGPQAIKGTVDQASELQKTLDMMTASQILMFLERFKNVDRPVILAREEDTGNVFFSQYGMYICMCPEGDCHS